MSGNPAAVVTGAEHLSDEAMQRVARFLNLSETVFLLPPRTAGADFFARTFTTRREIPFAGHATLATAHAYSEIHGGPDTVVQECAAGLMRIERRRAQESPEYFVDLPRAHDEATKVSSSAVAEALGLPLSALVDEHVASAGAGPHWLLAELTDRRLLADIRIDHRRAAELSLATRTVGITVFARGGGTLDEDIELRSFAPAEGIFEDPVCGSCAAAIAVHIRLGRGGPEVLFLDQGRHIGRSGRITVEARSGVQGIVLLLGGRCATVLRGALQV
jgi:PhzF family phenazine biosynthesis protein